MNECVLDASALLALFNNEVGADKVETVLPHSVMSAVNASEVIAELNKKLDISPEEGKTMINTVTKVLPFNLDFAAKTAQLRKETLHLGLSLGDRACLALGISLSLPVYTADKIWQKLTLPNKIILIR